MAAIEQPLPIEANPSIIIASGHNPAFDILPIHATIARIPGPKPAFITSDWLWGGLHVHMYRMRRAYTRAMLPSHIIGACSIVMLLILIAEPYDTPLRRWVTWHWLHALLLTFAAGRFGHIIMMFRMQNLVAKLQTSVEAQGWSIQWLVPSVCCRFFCFRWILGFEIYRMHNIALQEVPTNMNLYTMTCRTPHPRFLGGDAWVFPTPKDEWTMGGILYLMQQHVQQNSRSLETVTWKQSTPVFVVCGGLFLPVVVASLVRLCAVILKEWIHLDAVRWIVGVLLVLVHTAAAFWLFHFFWSNLPWSLKERNEELHVLKQQSLGLVNQELQNRGSRLVVSIQPLRHGCSMVDHLVVRPHPDDTDEV